jgi:hypothetical protein
MGTQLARLFTAGRFSTSGPVQESTVIFNNFPPKTNHGTGLKEAYSLSILPALPGAHASGKDYSKSSQL